MNVMLSRLINSPSVSDVIANITRRGGILAYHGIVESHVDADLAHLSVDMLRQQLMALEEQGSRFVPLGEFIDRVHRGKPVRRLLAVTFDDAYHGTIRLALPILRELSVPATLFVPAGFVEAAEGFWWDRFDFVRKHASPQDQDDWIRTLIGRPVSDDVATVLRDYMLGVMAGLLGPEGLSALRVVEASLDAQLPRDLRCTDWQGVEAWAEWDGGTCAAHTMSHPVLPLLPFQEQVSEIGSCIEALAQRIPHALPILAYPYGLYDQDTIRAARAAGALGAVTMDGHGVRSGGSSGPYRIPRIPLSRVRPTARIAWYVSPVGEWYRRRSMVQGYPRLPQSPPLQIVSGHV